ncbi:hypothetical protein D3C72_1470360 [compost metagenome]
MAKLIDVYTVCYSITLNVWAVPLTINWGNLFKVIGIVPIKALSKVPAAVVGKNPEHHSDEHGN